MGTELPTVRHLPRKWTAADLNSYCMSIQTSTKTRSFFDHPRILRSQIRDQNMRAAMESILPSLDGERSRSQHPRATDRLRPETSLETGNITRPGDGRDGTPCCTTRAKAGFGGSPFTKAFSRADSGTAVSAYPDPCSQREYKCE